MEALLSDSGALVWLIPLAVLIAFIESLAFAGIVVPGVALLFAVASAAGQQHINLYLLLGAAYTGAVAGDLFSFWLGRYAAPFVESRWPLKQHPEWIARGHTFFQRYGVYSVVLGRFIGPIRPVIPFVAGTLGMPARRFILFNLLSALVWAPAYILPGYLLGSSTTTIPESWSLPGYLMIALIILLLLFHKLHQWLHPEKMWASRLQDKVWRAGLWPAHKPVPLAALTLLFCSISMLITVLILRQYPHIISLNQNIHALLSEQLSDVPIIAGITMLGDKPLLSLLILAAAFVLYKTGRKILPVLLVPGLAIAGVLTNSAMKLWFAAERPEAGQWLTSYSFPSGHTSSATICLGIIATLIALPLSAPLRRMIYLVTLILVSAVALSRVGLGVHWPLDVLAALGVGGIFAATLRIMAGYLNWREQLSCNSSILLLLLSVVIVAGYLSIFWQDNLRLYGIAALS